MRRDLIIGLVVSVAIHGGAVWLSELGRSGPPKPPKKEDEPKVELIEMPKIDPDEPEVVENQEQQSTPVDFAPPMLNDVPQLVTDNSFTQQIQPPPPEGMRISANSFIIPQGKAGGLGKGIEVFDISKLDKQPIPRYQGRPTYPFEMRRAGISGDVLVDFIVDTNGDVKNAYAVKSSQHEFEASAVAAVNKWKFSPGRKGGRAVNTHMQVPIVFTLNEDN
jgi:protein TonB